MPNFFYDENWSNLSMLEFQNHIIVQNIFFTALAYWADSMKYAGHEPPDIYSAIKKNKWKIKNLNYCIIIFIENTEKLSR